MVKQFISFFTILIVSVLYSQDKSFVYELKFKPSAEKDSLVKQRFILDINDGKSMFRTFDEKESDSAYIINKIAGPTSFSFKDFKSVSKDLKSKTTRKYIVNFHSLYTITKDENLKWNIKDETKEILGLKSQRADLNYGGRNWIAWFSTEIPLQEGPYIFSGLPGLITEIYDTENNFNFTLIQIKKSNGELYEKEKALDLTWKQYEKLALDYYSDPTREISGKNVGSTININWVDENGQPEIPNFKEMNEHDQKRIRNNNNPIELNHKINYK